MCVLFWGSRGDIDTLLYYMDMDWSGIFLTFTTDADFKHAFSQAVSSGNAEAFVGRVFIGTRQDIGRRSKAESGNAFDHLIPHVGQVDRAVCRVSC